MVRPSRHRWTPNATGFVLAPNERGLILLEEQADVLGTVVLHDPDASSSSQADLGDASAIQCRSFIDLLTPTLSPWATPGNLNPTRRRWRVQRTSTSPP